MKRSTSLPAPARHTPARRGRHTSIRLGRCVPGVQESWIRFPSFNRHQQRRRAWRAFTLIETLVALGLLLVLVGAVFAFGMNLTASRDRLAAHMRRSQTVRVFLDRLEQDLHTALASDAGQGAGIVGDESSIRLLSRSVGAMGQTHGIASAMSDLLRSEYRWDNGGRTLQASRGAPDGGAAWNTIADDLGCVQWRYHDGRGWVTTFDSGATGRLPVAVEVAIWYVSPQSEADRTAAEAQAQDEQAPGGLANPDSTDEFGSLFGSRPAVDEKDDAAGSNAMEDANDARRDWPKPDRVRLIIIPDAPDFEYGRTYDDNVDLPASPPPVSSPPIDVGGGP